ncbi:hypothetical protein NMG60_11024137 [Bertholletia excelsa]
MAGDGGNDADQHHPKSYKFCKTDFFVTIVIVSALVLFAGMMSGLTLGLMSISLVDLEVLAKSGTPRDRIYACSQNLMDPFTCDQFKTWPTVRSSNSFPLIGFILLPPFSLFRRPKT